jgi:molybdenum cofactor cytidylyltransferase
MQNKKKINTSIVILAAGESSRLGQPKQLLRYNEKFLLQHIVDESCRSTADKILVVLGAFAVDIERCIDFGEVTVVHNQYWKTGMSTSIVSGLAEMLKINPLLESVIFVLCDQPQVTSELLNEILAKHFETGAEIVSCNYGNTSGPPVLFHKNLFQYLKELKGDVGAKSVMMRYSEKVSEVLFSEGRLDIDTLADYQKLLGKHP